MRKLAIYGLSGAGKSTTSRIVLEVCQARGHTAQVVKLAAPLYQLQTQIYALVGRSVEPSQQDQALLRALASHLRRLNSTFLVEDFLGRVERAAGDDGVDVVVNDDLKDVEVDYPRLAAAGFRFLHLTCAEEIRAQRLTCRVDLTQIPETAATWRFDRICPDWTLDTTADDSTALRAKIDALLGERWS